MGLDGVELVMAVEEAFGIEIQDDEAAGARRVKDLVALVSEKVGAVDVPPAGCAQQRAFHRARQAYLQLCPGHRSRFRLSARFGSLFGLGSLAGHWAEYAQKLGLDGPPPAKNRRIWLGIGAFFTIAAFFAGRSGHSFTAVVFFLLGLNTLGHAATALATYRVRDLVQVLVLKGLYAAKDSRSLTKSEVREMVHVLIKVQLGLEKVRDDDRFVQDLGVD